MRTRARVLHITPHLGGGVGKALLTLAGAQASSRFEHCFLLLEKPQKRRFVEGLERLGCPVAVEPAPALADAMILDADIVQLEWWNHPATFKFLCERPLPAMRLLVWCHVSGLRTPVIPAGFFQAAGRFVFTSPCSFEATRVKNLAPGVQDRIGVVSSGSGLSGPPAPDRPRKGPFRAGYVGSQNFSKLHPRYVDFLSAVSLPDFFVTLWGDDSSRDALAKQCRMAGKPNLIRFAGYASDPGEVLAGLDVFVYLLNPAHYGTAENALLEAMSAGVVPVVLDNPAERAIVSHKETGLIVDSCSSFAAAVERLYQNLDERLRLGKNAAFHVAGHYSPERMGASMEAQYEDLGRKEKQAVDFAGVFGDSPPDWFLSYQERPEDFLADIHGRFQDEYTRYGIFEKTKGSLFHFCDTFPDDPKLLQWKAQVEALRRP